MTVIACTEIGGMESFGECLKRRRLERGYSVSRLADEAEITRQAITRWEAGERVPTYPYRAALRDILGLAKSDDHGWWAP